MLRAEILQGLCCVDGCEVARHRRRSALKSVARKSATHITGRRRMLTSPVDAAQIAAEDHKATRRSAAYSASRTMLYPVPESISPLWRRSLRTTTKQSRSANVECLGHECLFQSLTS